MAVIERVLQGPAAEPVSLADLKRHARIELDEDDPWLTVAITAAREWFERRTRRTLLATELQVRLDHFPCAAAVMRLPRPPLISVEEIRYWDGSGDQQTLPSDQYRVLLGGATSKGGVEPVGSWPGTQIRSEAVEIDYIAGYGSDPADVPAFDRQLLSMLVTDWYERRLAKAEGVTATAEEAWERLIYASGTLIEF